MQRNEDISTISTVSESSDTGVVSFCRSCGSMLGVAPGEFGKCSCGFFGATKRGTQEHIDWNTSGTAIDFCSDADIRILFNQIARQMPSTPSRLDPFIDVGVGPEDYQKLLRLNGIDANSMIYQIGKFNLCFVLDPKLTFGFWYKLSE